MTEGNQTINGVKTFTSSPVFPGLSFATLTLTATSNQLTLGTGQTIIINAPTPAATRTYTIPDVLTNSSFVMTNGAQTFVDQITFDGSLVVSASSLIVSEAPSLQIILGGLATGIALSAPTPASPFVATIPDVLIDADFVMTEGNQTINGVKTFTSSPIFPGLSFASLTLTDTSNQLTLGSGNTILINGPTPAASRTYTIPDAGANADFVLTRGAVLTMNIPLVLFNSTTQFAISGTDPFLTISNGVGGGHIQVTGNTNIGTFLLPDTSTTSRFVITETNQTINGVKTFTSAPIFPGLSFASLTLTNTTNQLTLGTTNTTTITSPAPAASRTYTIPDAGGAASFVMTASAQTIAGTKTFSSAIVVNPTTNQIVLGVTNTTTINSVAPAASRTYTIPDAGGAANFVMSESAQTINGTKTFGSGILLPTSGGTPTAFDFYEVFTDTISWASTTYSGTQNQSVTYSRTGRTVMAQFTGFNVASSGGSGDGNINNAGDLVPTRFRPLTNTEVNMTVRNAGTTQVGVMFYQTTGEIQFYRTVVSGAAVTTANFQNGAGNVGFQSFSVGWVSA
jgi:hypothetical protein